MIDASKALQVVVTRGIEDGGRLAALAIGTALAAVAEGKETYLFLALDSTPVGTPTGCRGITPRGFTEALDDQIDTFLELGGHVEVCSSCYHEYCKHLPQGDDGAVLRPGVHVESLSILVDRAERMPVISF